MTLVQWGLQVSLLGGAIEHTKVRRLTDTPGGVDISSSHLHEPPDVTCANGLSSDEIKEVIIKAGYLANDNFSKKGAYLRRELQRREISQPSSTF